MITRTTSPLDTSHWQQTLAGSVNDPAELLDILGLDRALLSAARRAAARFPLKVTRYYLSLMRHGDPHDPLLRQVLPLAEELVEAPGFGPDPTGDRAASAGNGLLRKYAGRTLLITTAACAVNCRYCFRREFPYAEDNAGRSLSELSSVLGDGEDTREIILSGGDPLSLSDRKLADIVRQLDGMPQVLRLRLHSRVPVVLPDRITAALTRTLGESRLQCALVLHANHPAEVTPALGDSLRPLAAAGVTLLNQSVLLAGVNDATDTLHALSETLYANGILPYYLHLLDRVAGAAHFEVPLARARDMETALRARLPGYLVPRFVREVEGESGKLPLALA